MKKLIAMLALCAATVVGVNAQNSRTAQQTPEAEAQSVTDRMAKSLSLTEDQKTLVYRQNLERAMQVSKLRQMNASDEDKNRLIKQHYEVYEGQMKEILTEEQFQKFLTEKQVHQREAVKSMKN
jgi:hypothetical protein